MKKKKPLYQRVYEDLRGRVLSGVYTPGDLIQTEPELAEEYGVAVLTVRQAQNLLIKEGLLKKHQGRGTFVPASAKRKQRILCVCGLELTDGFGRALGGYTSDLIVYSHDRALQRGMEFETVWLSASASERIEPYCEETAIRENWAYLFLACGTQHALLDAVREAGLRYVSISSYKTTDNSVWPDIETAVGLALAEFQKGSPPIILGLDDSNDWVKQSLQNLGMDCAQYYKSWGSSDESVETFGYRQACCLLDEGIDLSQVLVLDDIMARGVSRALLRYGYASRDIQLVVLSGEQRIMPLGLPITYVVHDIEQEVDHAFSILEKQHPEKDTAPSSWCSGFKVVRDCEL